MRRRSPRSTRRSVPRSCKCWRGWSKDTGALRPDAPLLARAADPGARRIVVENSHRRHSPRQHGALVDVALVVDLAAVDGWRLGWQQGARGMAGPVRRLRLQLREPLRDRGANLVVADHLLDARAVR